MRIITRTPEAFLTALASESPQGLSYLATETYRYTFTRKNFSHAFANSRFLGLFIEDDTNVFFVMPYKGVTKPPQRFEAILIASDAWKPAHIYDLTPLNRANLLSRDPYRPISSYRLYTALKSIPEPLKNPIEPPNSLKPLPLKTLRKARSSLKKGTPIQEVLESLSLPIDYQLSILKEPK